VRLAHHLAIASDLIRSDCVEANEFPELSQRYMVMAVPKTVINEHAAFEGSLPEAQFVEQIMRAAGVGGEGP
jgi:hypothetical protein